MASEKRSEQNFFQRITAPHAEVKDETSRRRAWMVAALSLLFLVVDVPLLLVSLVNGGSFTQIEVLALTIVVLLLLAYGLSRSTRPDLGAGVLIIGILTAGNILFYRSNGDAEMATLLLIAAPVSILLAGLLLSARATIITAVYALLSFITFWFIVPLFSSEQGMIAVIITAVVGLLSSSNAYMRERDMSLIQKQSTELEHYGQTLSTEVDTRTQNIIAMSEIGQVMTGTRDLDTLLDTVIQMITERFDYYHAQVFMVDEVGKYALLTKSTGVAGQELLARGHKLEIGSRSVIGQVTKHGQSVVAVDTDIDAVHRRNELLPHTRSEMALPLRIGGRVIGALDIQSVNADAFDETTVSVFQTMADQLAIAIENTRLFERAQRDLSDIEMLNKQLTGEAWQQYLASRTGSPVGYRAGTHGVKALSSTETDTEAEEDGDGQKVTLPLKVRGETIGVLDVTSQDGSKPDVETQAMLEAVAERVAMALDSSRLSEQAQTQAEREVILSKLSAELQATTDLDVILRTAVQEAGRALNAGRGFIHLTAEYEQK